MAGRVPGPDHGKNPAHFDFFSYIFATFLEQTSRKLVVSGHISHRACKVMVPTRAFQLVSGGFVIGAMGKTEYVSERSRGYPSGIRKNSF